jgi:hypothetical protein
VSAPTPSAFPESLTINRFELVFARALLMKRAGDKFFATTGIAGDQH